MTLNKKSLFLRKRKKKDTQTHLEDNLQSSVVVGHLSLNAFSHSQKNCLMMCLHSLHCGGYTAKHWDQPFLFLRMGGMGEGYVGFNPGKNCLPPVGWLARVRSWLFVLSDLNQDFVITQTLCSLPCLFMVFVSEGWVLHVHEVTARFAFGFGGRGILCEHTVSSISF